MSSDREYAQLRTEHAHPEVEDGKREDDADPEADTPDSVEVVFAGGR